MKQSLKHLKVNKLIEIDFILINNVFNFFFVEETVVHKAINSLT